MDVLLSLFRRPPSSPKGRQQYLVPVSGSLPSGFVRFPTEILLAIASMLPPSALACFMLASKFLYNALSPGFDLRMEGCPEERSLLVRLLEKDLPHLVVCYSCDTLFDWRGKPHWRCPNHDNHPYFEFDPIWCYAHWPAFISREMVDLFIRGYQLGPQYGPQLRELLHDCDKDGGWFRTRGRKVTRHLDARIQQGLLIGHGVYSLTVPVPRYTIEASAGYIDRTFEYPLMREMGKFNGIGCVHLRTALPAVILAAVRQLNVPMPAPLCHDLINCGYCSTDLRVQARFDTETPVGPDVALIVLEVETWRCFGGRDIAARDPLEDAHFQIPGVRTVNLDINQPPPRNLQQLYEGGSARRANMLQVYPHRQSWLQRWRWSYAEQSERLWIDLITGGGSAIAIRAIRPFQPRKCFVLREKIKDIFDAMKQRLQGLKAPRRPWFSSGITTSEALRTILHSPNSDSSLYEEDPAPPGQHG